MHHVVCLPGLEEAERFAARLERIGNIASDGRPILGLDSRDLLEMLLESVGGRGAHPGAYLDALVLRARLEIRLRRASRSVIAI